MEALASRLTYVYGTGGNPLASELEARRAQAADAANYAGIPCCC